jgi:hypothetical protein
MNLIGQIAQVVELSANNRSSMFELMRRHYVNVDRATFDADLNDKRWVIELRAPNSNELVGFSTQTLMERSVEGRSVRALFSGDTIIDRDHWGDQTLVRTWFDLVVQLIERWPDEELWWFLISGGLRTYRFLPLFFRKFYPRVDQATPADVAKIIDILAIERYPHDYDPIAGVIRANAHQYYLRNDLAEINPERLRDPHVKYFAERNPGHTHGDELCCLAQLSFENLSPAAQRVYRKPLSIPK